MLSGRQDLNLRPLDPQERPARSITCGYAESAGQVGRLTKLEGPSERLASAVGSRIAPPNSLQSLPRTARHSHLQVGPHTPPARFWPRTGGWPWPTGPTRVTVAAPTNTLNSPRPTQPIPRAAPGARTQSPIPSRPPLSGPESSLGGRRGRALRHAGRLRQNQGRPHRHTDEQGRYAFWGIAPPGTAGVAGSWPRTRSGAEQHLEHQPATPVRDVRTDAARSRTSPTACW